MAPAGSYAVLQCRILSLLGCVRHDFGGSATPPSTKTLRVSSGGESRKRWLVLARSRWLGDADERAFHRSQGSIAEGDGAMRMRRVLRGGGFTVDMHDASAFAECVHELQGAGGKPGSGVLME